MSSNKVDKEYIMFADKPGSQGEERFDGMTCSRRTPWGELFRAASGAPGQPQPLTLLKLSTRVVTALMLYRIFLDN
jgi:hypothetical protein